MLRFSFKCFLIVLVLFFGVLLGMQQANTGMKKMKGYNDPSLYNAFTVTESDEGDIHASILGETVTSHDLAKKKEKLEEMKAYNFFSSVGKGMSEAVSSVFKKAFQFISDL